MSRGCHLKYPSPAFRRILDREQISSFKYRFGIAKAIFHATDHFEGRGVHQNEVEGPCEPGREIVLGAAETTDSISFPESHETERLFQEVQGNVEAMKQRYLFSALFSAGVMIPMGFEFGFRKRLHVVETRPEDWEEPAIDLRGFIRSVNAIKAGHRVFQRDCPTEIIGYENREVLLLWKACAEDPEEVLILLNKDIWHHQHFYADRLDDFVQAAPPLTDISPEYRLDFLPDPFVYDLRPGQGFVLLARRED